ncbi:MerR family transcriptional regulator [Clostridium boliviensis]|uniref:MerR family transcriptional regulator n=1 Tax=Clostridium boliviensis TaxID=318465 RepID=A0ABU4GL03_9CLOT|nr:MerR family transcriptional regulator [Clostridium boliviensis]MDW2797670.1 MerR family transcriptional regulator [Clostridium boliviensis]
MLRYYDSQGLLKPSVIDPVTGYRMYSAEQVPELQKIIMLRDLNFGVAEAKDLLQNWNSGHLIQSLHYKIKDIEQLIRIEQNRIGQSREHIEYDRSNQNNVAIYHDEEHLDFEL